jgi:serine/threonine protein kinase/formylglycine-generating enzyme required for sulfatase activity
MPAREPDTRKDVTLPQALVGALESLLFRGGSEAARDAGVVELCARHPEHAVALRRWLAAVQGLGAGSFGEDAEDGGDVPRQIGPYRLIGRLGQGGFGDVYLAEQEHPVRRRVALKVLRLGMDSEQVLQRFAREQDALARMNHDAIAKIYDAGTTPTGQPFFAMELVDGAPLVACCERDGLSLRARLDLFVATCLGVHHAHQKGVVHRDLKPSNVLVTKVGERHQPKLIDFGIARALEGDASNPTLTEAGVMLGTPAYMAPEQARGDLAAIDTMTDVYALGAILFELLTGVPPYGGDGVSGSSPWELRQRILDAETPRPSRMRTTTATKATSWRRQLGAELDWIVLKAMAKGPEERYPSAAELAADVARFLAQEPVSAGPPSATYRLRKFVRRHRLTVAAGAMVLSTAITGALVSWRWANVAEANAQVADGNAAIAAQRARELAAKVAEFDRLASVVQLEAARSAERELHPAWPAQVGALRRWLQDVAQPLLAKRRDLGVAVEALAQRARPMDQAMRQAARERDARWRQLLELRERRDALLPLVELGGKQLHGEDAGQQSSGFAASLRQVLGKEPPSTSPRASEEQLLADALAACKRQLEQVAAAERALAAAIDDDVVPAFDETAEAFLFVTLRRVARELDAFEQGDVARVQQRLQWAERLASSFDHPDAPWTWVQCREQLAAATAIGSASPYAGCSLDLGPQPGLVPLGRNERTGLFEFYDLASAAESGVASERVPLPGRRPDGTFAMGPESGIVFVLLPGGPCAFGSQNTDPKGRHFDPMSTSDDRVCEAQLRPFLLARHELSQGQWRRLARALGERPRPSFFASGTTVGLVSFGDLHPVEMVSWTEAERLLRRCGMSLPSEAQWEYACRAGSTTPWSCEPGQLVVCANLADQHYGVAAVRTDVEPWDDLYAGPAPIGSLRPNAFGLHDMHGNVAEWCSDESGKLGAPLRELDGRRTFGDGTGMRVVRGGFFGLRAPMVRSAARAQAAVGVQSSQYGVRAMRLWPSAAAVAEAR